jgi:hypothetical protein
MALPGLAACRFYGVEDTSMYTRKIGGYERGLTVQNSSICGGRLPSINSPTEVSLR